MMILTAVGVVSLGAGLALQYWSCDVSEKKSHRSVSACADYDDYLFLKDKLSSDLYHLEIFLGIRNQNKSKRLSLTPLDRFNHPRLKRFTHKLLMDTDYVKANQLCQSLLALQARLDAHQGQSYYKSDFVNKFLRDRIQTIHRHLLTYKQLHHSD